MNIMKLSMLLIFTSLFILDIVVTQPDSKYQKVETPPPTPPPTDPPTDPPTQDWLNAVMHRHNREMRNHRILLSPFNEYTSYISGILMLFLVVMTCGCCFCILCLSFSSLISFIILPNLFNKINYNKPELQYHEV